MSENTPQASQPGDCLLADRCLLGVLSLLPPFIASVLDAGLASFVEAITEAYGFSGLLNGAALLGARCIAGPLWDQAGAAVPLAPEGALALVASVGVLILTGASTRTCTITVS